MLRSAISTNLHAWYSTGRKYNLLKVVFRAKMFSLEARTMCFISPILTIIKPVTIKDIRHAESITEKFFFITT